MVRRHELTDQAWAEIAPLLPKTGRPGGQWAEHRRVVNGILWKLATGCPGGTCPIGTGPGRPVMSDSAAGRLMGPGSGCEVVPLTVELRWRPVE